MNDTHHNISCQQVFTNRSMIDLKCTKRNTKHSKCNFFLIMFTVEFWKQRKQKEHKIFKDIT